MRRSGTSSASRRTSGLSGITDGEFRRTYFHVDFLEQLDGVETKGGIAVRFHTAQGNVEFAPPVMKVTGPVRHVEADPGRRLRIPEVGDASHAEGHDPVADDAALPRRARGDQPRRLPRPRGLLRRRRRGVPRGDRRARRRRLPLPAARRHEPRLSLRREDARRARASAATIPTSCRGATRGSSTRRSPTDLPG